MEIKFFGHSAFQLDNLVVDPFLSGNPLCNDKAEDVSCEIVALTHDHDDHLGDTWGIAERNQATFVAMYELALVGESKGIRSIGMNMGGTVEAGNWKIKMTPAWHSSNLGAPAGFVFTHESGLKIYHAGDTALFSDMKLIGDMGIDIAILPIGDTFTMGIEDAAKAVEFIRPKKVIPCHYNTFPPIDADPEAFAKLCNCEVVVMNPGDSVTV